MSSGVLFSGYYGLGNAGDEAVLAASVDLLRRRSPGLGITALSATPDATAKSFRIQAAPRMQPAQVLAQIRRSRLFLSGGGSLLQDTTSLKSLLYYLGLLRLAQLSGCRTMIWSQGIGPLIRPKARRWTAGILRRCDAITVRDADSAELLAEIGIQGKGVPEVRVTADPVFALEPRPSPRMTAYVGRRPSVAIALRDWPGAEALLDPLAEVLGQLPGDVSLQAWPLQPERDLPIAEALAARVPRLEIIREELTPGEWMALAGEVDAVVAMRLHALIFAAAQGTPALGISYDPKVDSLLDRLKTRPVGTVESLRPEALRSGLEAVLKRDEAARRNRLARAGHLREAAGRSAEIALELLRA